MSPRDRILARRTKFIAAALAGASAIGCSDAEPAVCLEPLGDSGADTTSADTGTDTGRADTTTDTGPTACLSPALDSGVSDSAATDSSLTDSGADTKTADSGPMPCLVPPIDGG